MRRRPRPSSRRAVVKAIELLLQEGGRSPLDVQAEHALGLVEGILVRDEASFGRRFGELQHRVIAVGRRVWIVAPIEPPVTAFGELMDMAVLQAQLIPHHVLVRGAVSVGDVEIHPRVDLLVGPGMTEANRLHELADVPRVVVDPRTILEIESNVDLRSRQHSVAQELQFVRKLLRQDSDGLWFVDYLAVYAREAPASRARFLTDHLDMIAYGLASAVNLDRSTRVWTWLWRYHNTVIDELHAEGQLDRAARDELRIPPVGPFLYSFPVDLPPRSE